MPITSGSPRILSSLREQTALLANDTGGAILSFRTPTLLGVRLAPRGSPERVNF